MAEPQAGTEKEKFDPKAIAAAQAAEKNASKEAKAVEKESKQSDREASIHGVSKSRVLFSGFKGKSDPDKLAREEAKHKKLNHIRVENRIKKAKKLDKMKPVDKRRSLLIARLRGAKNRNRPRSHSIVLLELFAKELEFIQQNPKGWTKVTKNGTIPYGGHGKKASIEERLEAMDLDDPSEGFNDGDDLGKLD